MKEHKQWICIQAYFKDIPINPLLKSQIDAYLEQKANILILILKEEPESEYSSASQWTPKDKFKALCDLYPEETKKCQIIISQVPDIIHNVRFDL